jgi:hypothetical protein
MSSPTCRRDQRRREWKPDDEFRALPGCTLDLDAAAALACELACLVGADTEALLALRAVEGAEEPVANELLIHAAAGVHYLEDRLLSDLANRYGN